MEAYIYNFANSPDVSVFVLGSIYMYIYTYSWIHIWISIRYVNTLNDHNKIYKHPSHVHELTANTTSLVCSYRSVAIMWVTYGKYYIFSLCFPYMRDLSLSRLWRRNDSTNQLWKRLLACASEMVGDGFLNDKLMTLLLITRNHICD